MNNDRSCYINGEWLVGSGAPLISENPCDGSVVWSGPEADVGDVIDAVLTARMAQIPWGARPLDERIAVVARFAELVEADRPRLASVISAETGKPLWEADTEVAAVVGKVGLSVEAHAAQNPDVAISDVASMSHRPLGVVGVLGPFNFPAHLANGQIIPALIAGNAVVYKPSELTPAVATTHVHMLAEAGVPPGVLNLVIGGRGAGEALVDSEIDAVAFTGSVSTGQAIHRSLADRPDVLLALEMGGNNPLVVGEVADIDAAVNVILRSAFITSGQRCTCARRLYLRSNPAGDNLLAALVDATDRLRVGAPGGDDEPFMGPVINARAADLARGFVRGLTDAGASLLTSPDTMTGAFVRPAVVAVNDVEVPDDEVFGPVLTVHRYENLDDAYLAATDTAYGLAAGLISDDPSDFELFAEVVKAGVVNFNCPTTGASGRLPFGGVGASGNHRPAGWAAADFCAYPVATMTYASARDAVAPIQGID